MVLPPSQASFVVKVAIIIWITVEVIVRVVVRDIVDMVMRRVDDGCLHGHGPE
jgi:hypothetical protein